MSDLFSNAPRDIDIDSVPSQPKSGEWSTPQHFFDALNDEFDLIWDVCASHRNSKLAFYWTKEEDGLSADWRGKRIWMHPPRGRDLRRWVAKAANGGAEICVCLLPARTDTRWFHRYIIGNPRAEVRFVKGRLKFSGARKSSRFPNMVVIFRGEVMS